MRGPRPHVTPHNKGKKSSAPSATAQNWHIVNVEDKTDTIVLSLRKWSTNMGFSYQNIHTNYANKNKPYKGYLIYKEK